MDFTQATIEGDSKRIEELIKEASRDTLGDWLLETVRYGDEAIFLKLLSAGADPNKALNLAVFLDSKLLPRLLKQPGVSLNSSHLSDVVYNQNMELLRSLLSNPSVDPRFNNNEAIKVAIKDPYPSLEVIKLLLDWGDDDKFVDPTVENNFCIQMAVSKNNIEIVKLLLGWKRKNHTVDPTGDRNFCIIVAVENNNIELVQLLLDWKSEDGKRIDPNVPRNILLYAINSRRLKMVEFLLKDGRVNVGNNAFFTAVQGFTDYDVEIVRLLLGDRRIDPSAEHSHAMKLVRDARIMELLLKDGRADPTIENNFALYNAVMSNDVEITRLLLADRRLDVSLNGDILGTAVEDGYTNMVRLLLTDGRFDPNFEDPDPLYIAVHNGYHGIVDLIMKDGRAEMDDLLVVAIENLDIQMVELLLQSPEVQPEIVETENQELNRLLRTEVEVRQAIRNTRLSPTQRRIMLELKRSDMFCKVGDTVPKVFLLNYNTVSAYLRPEFERVVASEYRDLCQYINSLQR